jgi:hypothetical protein
MAQPPLLRKEGNAARSTVVVNYSHLWARDYNLRPMV